MFVLFGGVTWRSALLVLMDHALIVLGVVAAVFARQSEAAVFGWPLLLRAILIASGLQLALHYSDLYDLRSLRDRRDLIVGVLQAIGVASAILALLYYWVPVLSVGRGVFFLAAVFILVLIIGWRLVFE